MMISIWMIVSRLPAADKQYSFETFRSFLEIKNQDSIVYLNLVSEDIF